MSMTNWRDPNYWWGRADEARVIGDTFRDKNTRDHYTGLADQLDRMAERLIANQKLDGMSRDLAFKAEPKLA